MNLEIPNTERLPKWAQETMKSLQRERDDAIDTLKQFTDDQTPTAVFYDEMHPRKDGLTHSIKYIQSDRITFRIGAENFEVSVNLAGIRIRSNTGRLRIKPEAANTVFVESI